MRPIARRWTPIAVAPFELVTDEGQHHWLGLLKATERELVLARARPGMLVREADYLFERTTGCVRRRG